MAAKMTLEQDGTFYELERLQESANRRSVKYEAEKKEKSELSDLQSKVEQLRARRDQLRERLKNGPHEILQEFLQLDESSRKDYSAASKQNVLTAVRLFRKRKLADLCDSYRLMGISIVSQQAKRTCFRFETFFNSRYYEPYNLEVELKDNNLKIHKHTVPYFIPVDAISKQYLNTDIKRFFMIICEHLNAFVARREQVCLCQEQHGDKLEGEISCSPSHDFVMLKLKAAQGQVKGTIVKLTYRGLTSTRPSHIDLVTEGKSAVALRRLQRKRKFFEDFYLHQAFAEAFNEEFET
nr:centromere protein O-like [Pocillopora verrucosa]